MITRCSPTFLKTQVATDIATTLSEPNGGTTEAPQ